MTKRLEIPLLLSCLLLTACQANSSSPDAAATVPPLVLQLSDKDTQLLQQSRQSALEKNSSGQTRTWNNARTGHSGSVTPTQTFKNASGRYCREYRSTLHVAEMTTSYTQVACRSGKGVWLTI